MPEFAEGGAAYIGRGRHLEYNESCLNVRNIHLGLWWHNTAPWLVPSLPTISFTHPHHPDRYQTVHRSHQVFALHQQWTWLGLCAPWLIPSPPTISFTQPNHPDRS